MTAKKQRQPPLVFPEWLGKQDKQNKNTGKTRRGRKKTKNAKPMNITIISATGIIITKFYDYGKQWFGGTVFQGVVEKTGQIPASRRKLAYARQKLAPTTGHRGSGCSLLSISKYHLTTNEYIGGI